MTKSGSWRASKEFINVYFASDIALPKALHVFCDFEA